MAGSLMPLENGTEHEAPPHAILKKIIQLNENKIYIIVDFEMTKLGSIGA